LPEVISNTSPLQYLHQLGKLELLCSISGGKLIVPGAVAEELDIGRSRGVDLPEPGSIDWITIRSPQSE